MGKRELAYSTPSWGTPGAGPPALRHGTSEAAALLCAFPLAREAFLLCHFCIGSHHLLRETLPYSAT